MPADPPTLALLRTPCKVLRAANDSGERRPSEIRLVVVHSTEGGTARSNALWFAKPSTKASTQLVVDNRGCYRCVPDLVIPWGAPGANRHGLHVEHVGFTAWDRETWLEHRPTLERAAAKVGRWCWLYRIPRRWLTVAELKAGKRGLCTHADASAAFPPNDGHHDPGPGFPKAYYLSRVKHFYGLLAAERATGADS